MINGAQLLSVARESNCAIALGYTMIVVVLLVAVVVIIHFAAMMKAKAQ